MNKPTKQPRNLSESGLEDFLVTQLGIDNPTVVLVLTEDPAVGHTFSRDANEFTSQELDAREHRITGQSAIEFVDVATEVAGCYLCRICTPWGYFWSVCCN